MKYRMGNVKILTVLDLKRKKNSCFTIVNLQMFTAYKVLILTIERQFSQL